MIGNSVVPGLPNRWVMPSSLSNARNAERPVMRFMKILPFPRPLPRYFRHHCRSAKTRSRKRDHGCPALVGPRLLLYGLPFNSRSFQRADARIGVRRSPCMSEATGTANRPPHDGLPAERRRWAVAAIFTAITMASLDTAIANIALPATAADFHVGLARA